MISDKNTNMLFFSKQLTTKYKADWERIQETVEEDFHLLESTNDVWVRDFMPIQLDEDKFICFKYNPSYLSKSKSLITDQKVICDNLMLNPIYSPLLVDGGNIVKGENRVIITDRIFKENKKSEPGQLVKAIEDLLQSEVILFPSEEDDFLGHSDGMVRFIDDDSVIINDLSKYNVSLRKKIEKVIQTHKLEYYEIPYEPNDGSISAEGYYINFLEIGNSIYIPIFKNKDNANEKAFEVISKIYKERNIETILLTSIAKDGGLLNCISWSIKNSKNMSTGIE
jgi:agmatine deiminase